MFASTDLLEKYWQKLIRSYAAKSVSRVVWKTTRPPRSRQRRRSSTSKVAPAKSVRPNPTCSAAPGIPGNGYKVFKLTALTPKGEYMVHFAKMAYQGQPSGIEPIGMRRY